jgi:GMP synthase-like glutamine amidotransferase
MLSLRWVFHITTWQNVIWCTLRGRYQCFRELWYCGAPGFEVCTSPQLIFEVAGIQLTSSGPSTGREGGRVMSGSGSEDTAGTYSFVDRVWETERRWVRKHMGATPRKLLPFCLGHFFVSTVFNNDVTSHTSARYDICWRTVHGQASAVQAPCYQKHLLHNLYRCDVLIGWGRGDDPDCELVSKWPYLVCPIQCGPLN